jgi:hypothetical protein
MRYKTPKDIDNGRAPSHTRMASRTHANGGSDKAVGRPQNEGRRVFRNGSQNGIRNGSQNSRQNGHASKDDRVPQAAAGRRLPVATVIVIVAVVGLALILGYLIISAGASGGNNPAATDIDSALQQKAEPTPEEVRLMEALDAGASADDPNVYYLPTPLVASCGNMGIHSPIAPSDITEIEFHQASYDYALPLTPLVTIVDAEEVAEKHGTKRPPFSEQPYGDQPLIAEAVSTLRMDSEGAEMSSIDVGALTGMYVYAPVSGTVVRIKSYRLFGQIDDYEVHIQSPEYPQWDIVLLHIDSLMVDVGDQVYGGCTRVAKVRNIGDVIDNNLANFTRLGDPGNHCHVQVNDVTRHDYRGLEGALDIFDGRGYARPEPPPDPEQDASS